MLKRLAAALLSVALCVLFGVSVSAEDNSARIAEIEAQIAELQAELRELKGEIGAEEGGILYQDDLVTITYDGIDGEESDYDIKVIIENTSTDHTLTVQARETSINGFMVKPLFSAEVAPGKKIKDGLSIKYDVAEEYPMSEVESVETKFMIYKDSLTDFYETDNIVIK